MKIDNIPEEKRENTKRTITNLIFCLKKQNRKLCANSTGKQEKWIALKSWFDKNRETLKEVN